MIDVHAHFADEGYDFPAEWEKIGAAGVNKVILAADTLAHAAWHAGFCADCEGAFFTVGVHPEFAGDAFSEEEFFSLARHPKCVAVGEIGLDYHYPGIDKRAQRELFIRQILLAEQANLPLQIHSRDACEDTMSVLRELKPHLARGFLMHCYSYGAENLEDFLELGAYFSFGGVVCFKNARRAVEAALRCPLDRILSETDSPYLSPFRGEKNTPANIPVIAEKLADIKGVALSEMLAAIRENAARLFPKLQ